MNMVINTLPVTDKFRNQLREETAKDEQLTTLMITNHYRDELTVKDGIVLKGDHLVIPKILRKSIFDIIHEGHLGEEKCKRRAREAMFWPRINKDIVNKVSGCATCIVYRNQHQKEPL